MKRILFFSALTLASANLIAQETITPQVLQTLQKATRTP